MPDIAIIPAGGSDRWGDDEPGGDPVVVRRPKMWPRDSAETQNNVLISGWSVYIPKGKPVPTAADSVMVDVEVDAEGGYVAGTGTEYHVTGDPGPYYAGGNRQLKGTLVNLERSV